MAKINLTDVSISFPIYNAKARSFKTKLIPISVGARFKKEYDEVLVNSLVNISLEIEEGERLGIIGHNGAGKTTLLRVLSGIYEPITGSIDIQGKISSLTDLTMGMDYEATGYENIFTRGIFMGMGFTEINEKIPEIAEFSELGDYLNLPMRTYSMGMMVRLAFSVSTIVEPEILIMDEMIGAGDAAFLNKAQNRMNQLLDKANIVVIASHDMGLVDKFCSRVILLEQGEITFNGSPKEAIERYIGVAQ